YDLHLRHLHSSPTRRSSDLQEGNVWMVHSGGFYVVDKQTTPQILPKTLHWFKWEAMLTWLSGIVLLTIVYYFGGIMSDDDSLLQDRKSTRLNSSHLGISYAV